MPAERTRLRNLSREMRKQQERGPSPPTFRFAESVKQWDDTRNDRYSFNSKTARLAPDVALVSIIPAIVPRITPRVFASPFAASGGCATCKTTTRGSLWASRKSNPCKRQPNTSRYRLEKLAYTSRFNFNILSCARCESKEIIYRYSENWRWLGYIFIYVSINIWKMLMTRIFSYRVVIQN